MKTSILMLVTLVTVVLSQPMKTIEAMSKRVDARGVYMCRDKLFNKAGGCEWINIASVENKCLPLHCDNLSTCLVTGMEGVWMSFGPDKGVSCTLFASNTCRTSMRNSKIETPGTGDLLTWSTMSARGANGQPITYTSFSCHYV